MTEKLKTLMSIKDTLTLRLAQIDRNDLPVDLYSAAAGGGRVASLLQVAIIVLDAVVGAVSEAEDARK